MPRLMKYSSNKTLSAPFKEVDDNYLRAIEYGGFSYLIDTKMGSKSAVNKAISLSVVIALYEYAILEYYAPGSTAVKNTTTMNDRNGGKNK